MPNFRNYGAGVVPALTSLARGKCYFPDCDENLTKFVGDIPVNNFEVAHIRAANVGGPRDVEGMAQDERNSFANLVLLCLPHHKIVDKIRRDDFTTEMLQAWKVTRESQGLSELQGLRNLTEDRLQEMINGAFADAKRDFEDALKQLRAIDPGAAGLLQPVVDEWARAQFLDLTPDEGIVTQLASAVDRLQNLEGIAGQLNQAASSLQGAEGVANFLTASTSEFVEQIAIATKALEGAVRSAGQFM